LQEQSWTLIENITTDKERFLTERVTKLEVVIDQMRDNINFLTHFVVSNTPTTTPEQTVSDSKMFKFISTPRTSEPSTQNKTEMILKKLVEGNNNSTIHTNSEVDNYQQLVEKEIVKRLFSPNEDKDGNRKFLHTVCTPSGYYVQPNPFAKSNLHGTIKGNFIPYVSVVLCMI